MKAPQRSRCPVVRVASDDAATSNVGVKLPNSHLSSSAASLKALEASTNAGVNSTLLVVLWARRCANPAGRSVGAARGEILPMEIQQDKPRRLFVFVVFDDDDPLAHVPPLTPLSRSV